MWFGTTYRTHYRVVWGVVRRIERLKGGKWKSKKKTKRKLGEFAFKIYFIFSVFSSTPTSTLLYVFFLSFLGCDVIFPTIEHISLVVSSSPKCIPYEIFMLYVMISDILKASYPLPHAHNGYVKNALQERFWIFNFPNLKCVQK